MASSPDTSIWLTRSKIGRERLDRFHLSRTGQTDHQAIEGKLADDAPDVLGQEGAIIDRHSLRVGHRSARPGEERSMVISVFRSRLRAENAEEFYELAARMRKLAAALPCRTR